MQALQVVNEQEVLGKWFRIYEDFDNPLFLAKDVAEWIEYAYKDARKIHRDVSKMLSTVDEDEKQKAALNLGGEDYSHGGIRENTEMWFLTENGLYEVLMQSRKPIAKQFKKEVKEILKSIRKHGIYATDNVIDRVLADPDFGIKLLVELKAEREERQRLEQQAETDRPKVLFADAVSTAKTSILIGELAKIMRQNGVEMGEKRLFEWLRENGYLVKRKGTDYNAPTQRSMELGLFEVKETAITHNDGHVTISKTTKVTGKGQQYFISKFLQEAYMCV